MITKKFLILRTSSKIKNNKAKRSSPPYSQARKIGILFSADTREKFNYIKEFINKLENEEKEVKVLSYLGRKKENYEFRFEIFTSKDVSLWGKFKTDIVKSFINEEFDYLFCIDMNLNPFVENILASSKAKCRIGKFKEDKSQLFELMIDLNKEEGIQALVNNMYYYTKKITRNGSSF